MSVLFDKQTDPELVKIQRQIFIALSVLPIMSLIALILGILTK